MQPGELAALITKAVDCPWLIGCTASTSKRERRAERVRAPETIDQTHAVYRSDGACRGESRTAGWGAAYWGPGQQGLGAPVAHACGYIGDDSTNNVAEYRGLRAVLRRAHRRASEPCVIDVDSLLVCRQVRGDWSCRDAELRPWYDECVALYASLRARGQSVRLRHVYREYNAVADVLANEGVDFGGVRGGSWATTAWGDAE